MVVGVGGRRAGGRESMKSGVKERRRVRAPWVFVHSSGSSATASVLGLAAAGSVHDGASTSGSGPGGVHVRPSHCCCPAPRRPHGRPPLGMARRLPKTGATTTISSLYRYRRRVLLSHRHFVTLPNSHAFPQAPSPSGRLGVPLRAQRRRRPRSVVASWPSFAASCFWRSSGRVQNNKQMSLVSSPHFFFLRLFNPACLRHAWSSRETGHIMV